MVYFLCSCFTALNYKKNVRHGRHFGLLLFTFLPNPLFMGVCGRFCLFCFVFILAVKNMCHLLGNPSWCKILILHLLKNQGFLPLPAYCCYVHCCCFLVVTSAYLAYCCRAYRYAAWHWGRSAGEHRCWRRIGSVLSSGNSWPVCSSSFGDVWR